MKNKRITEIKRKSSEIIFKQGLIGWFLLLVCAMRRKRMDNEIKQIKTILDGMKEDEEFIITNMIVKYADEIDFDSLPDPDVYLQKRYIYESYKAYMKFRNKKTK